MNYVEITLLIWIIAGTIFWLGVMSNTLLFHHTRDIEPIRYFTLAVCCGPVAATLAILGLLIKLLGEHVIAWLRRK